MGFLDKLLGRAKETAHEAAEQADELADQAKSAVGDMAEKHGDAVTGAVDRAADFVDEKTGGRLGSVPETVSEAAHDAVDALRGGDEGEPPAAEQPAADDEPADDDEPAPPGAA